MSSYISLIIGIISYWILYLLNSSITDYCSRNMSENLINKLNRDHENHNDIPLKVDKSMTMAKITLSNESINKSKQNYALIEESIGYLRIIILNFCFTIALFSTVNSWRGFWSLQNIYMYPLIISNNYLINLLILHSIYLLITIIILSSLNTVCSSMSRAGSEDDLFYFGTNGIVTKRLFRLFFIKEEERRESFTKVKKFN